MSRFRPFLITLALVAVIALILSLPAFAQGSSIVDGSVKDDQGTAIVGATVTVKNLDSGAQQMATTDSSGLYVVTNLARGRYEVIAEAAGFAPATQSGVTLQVGTRVTLAFILQHAGGSPPQVTQPPEALPVPSPTPEDQPQLPDSPTPAPQATVTQTAETQPAGADVLPHTGQPFPYSVLYLAGSISVVLGTSLRRLP